MLLERLLDNIPELSTSIAALGLLMMVWQYKKMHIQNRQMLVEKCIDKLISDERISLAFYRIENEPDKYDDPIEFTYDDQKEGLFFLVSNFSTVAQAWEAGLLKDSDLKPLLYYLNIMFSKPGIKKYIDGKIKDTESLDIYVDHPYVLLRTMVENISKKYSPNKSLKNVDALKRAP